MARVRRQLLIGAMGDDAERARAPRHDRAALGPTGLTPVKRKNNSTVKKARRSVLMGLRAQVSRCPPRQFDVPHVQSAAHLEFEWLRAPLVWPIWLSELTAPTFTPKVALGHTSEAGLKKHLGKVRATT